MENNFAIIAKITIAINNPNMVYVILKISLLVLCKYNINLVVSLDAYYQISK